MSSSVSSPLLCFPFSPCFLTTSLPFFSINYVQITFHVQNNFVPWFLLPLGSHHYHSFNFCSFLSVIFLLVPFHPLYYTPLQLLSLLHPSLCGILRRTMPPKRNITREQEKALGDLQEMNEIILPADKGNMTVVMSKADYHQKMMDLIATPTYVAITRDPIAAQDRKIGTS